MCTFNAPEMDTRLLSIYSRDLDFGVSCKFSRKIYPYISVCWQNLPHLMEMREPYIEVSPFACHMYSV